MSTPKKDYHTNLWYRFVTKYRSAIKGHLTKLSNANTKKIYFDPSPLQNLLFTALILAKVLTFYDQLVINL